MVEYRNPRRACAPRVNNLIQCALSFYPNYQGLDVIAKKTVKVINKEQHVVWDGYGLRLHIPSNSLPDDLSQFTLRIEVVQTGNFELPDGDGILVSAIYSFSHDLGDRKVCHPVTVEMQHCAPTTALNNLRIVRADEKSVQPWKLQFMTVDISNCSDGYGAFKMHHFCSIAIYFRLHVASLFWTLKPYAKLYFMNIKRRSFDFNLYILPCLDALLKVCMHFTCQLMPNNIISLLGN